MGGELEGVNGRFSVLLDEPESWICARAFLANFCRLEVGGMSKDYPGECRAIPKC